MSTQEYPQKEQATDGDPVAAQQPADAQPADADDEVETAVDAHVAEDEADVSGQNATEPGE